MLLYMTSALYLCARTPEVFDSSIALGENSERKQEGMLCIMCPLMAAPIRVAHGFAWTERRRRQLVSQNRKQARLAAPC